MREDQRREEKKGEVRRRLTTKVIVVRGDGVRTEERKIEEQRRCNYGGGENLPGGTNRPDWGWEERRETRRGNERAEQVVRYRRRT